MGFNFLFSDRLIEDNINYYHKNGIPITEEFLRCAELQLKNDFELKTGIKINKNVGFSIMYPNIQYEKGKVSQFNQNFFVNHHWNLVTIKWKSKSGRIYEVQDRDIDCDDIIFWIDKLDVPLIHKQLYPKQDFPFKLKELSYELVVTRINMDCTIELSPNASCDKSENTKKIDEYINSFNERSDKQGRRHGVVHNWKSTIQNEKIVYELDLGSTGVYFLKKLLSFFSELNCFDKVELC